MGTYMRINEVMKETGLSKRTIYYYIDENLITPKIDANNGYNIFSTDDVEKLRNIRQLRKLDFTISDIQDMLQHPNAMHIYLQKQVEKMVKDLRIVNEKIKFLNGLNNQLPIIATYKDLTLLLQTQILSNKIDQSINANRENDSKLISSYLFGAFLQELSMSEYRQFLWEKILKFMTGTSNPNIAVLKQYLYNLSAKQMDKEFIIRNQHIQEVVKLRQEDLGNFIDKLKLTLTEFVTNNQHQKYWKDRYFTCIVPSANLFSSQINELICELSPSFSSYYNNLITCCSKVYGWLYTKEGEHLRIQLLDVMQEFLDIESNNHGELAAISLLQYN